MLSGLNFQSQDSSKDSLDSSLKQSIVTASPLHLYEAMSLLMPSCQITTYGHELLRWTERLNAFWIAFPTLKASGHMLKTLNVSNHGYLFHGYYSFLQSNRLYCGHWTVNWQRIWTGLLQSIVTESIHSVHDQQTVIEDKVCIQNWFNENAHTFLFTHQINTSIMKSRILGNSV